MKLLLLTGIISVILLKVKASTEGDAHMVELMSSQRDLDMSIKSKSKYHSITRMRRPSVEAIEQNIHYSGSVLCSIESLKTWSCKSCLKAASRSDIKNLTFFEDNYTEGAGYITANTALKTILLVFRGAHSSLNDMHFTDSVTVPFNLIPRRARVNRGILKTMESLSFRFIDLVEQLLTYPKYRDYSITLVGHSLGSTIAPLAAIKLKNHFKLPWKKFNLFSYGQPRIGNSHFARWFNHRPLTAARIVNSHDFVTQFPTKASGSHTHHHHLYYIDQERNTTQFCRSDILEDPNCYIYPDFTLENIVSHVNYLGVRLQPEFAC